MTSPVVTPLFALVDAKALLARIDPRIAALRRVLGHDHRDEPYWAARGLTAPQAQSRRRALREVANLLHVERATTRGRIHGTWFATLENQRTWLAAQAHRHRNLATWLAELPDDTALLKTHDSELRE